MRLLDRPGAAPDRAPDRVPDRAPDRVPTREPAPAPAPPSAPRHRAHVRHHRSRLAVLFALVAVFALTAFDAAPTTMVTATIDLTHPVQATDEYAIGVGVSTYGALAAPGSVQAYWERRLDARSVRVPVAFRNGRVSSGAAGAGETDVVGLVKTYRSWGFHVLVVIDGRTDDVDVAPGDTTAIVQALGYGPDLQYSTSNEPGNLGRDIASVVTQAQMMLSEARVLYPDFRIWGPAWVDADRSAFQTLARALGSSLAGIDFHSYAMGSASIGTDEAFATTPALGRAVRQTVSDLAGMGLSAGVAVDETNLTWRYEDGTPGGNKRLFTAVATAWIASACGHVLEAGGQCMPYASQNGPLGMTVEADSPNPDARQVSTPMPAYWGIAAWTGGSVFPHMTGNFYETTVGDGPLEVYAVDNSAGGRNLVVVNTSSSSPVTATLRLRGSSVGTYVGYATDPDHPYDAPVALPKASYNGGFLATIQPMSVVTYVLSPTTRS